MRSSWFMIARLTALVLMPLSAEAEVRVNFVNPQSYQDRDFRSTATRESVIAEFRRYFDRLGSRYLKEGQSLSIDVLDADLAGEYEPWRRTFNDVRILRDVTPPRFKLRYTLTQRGTVLMSAEEIVTDINYLWDPSASSSTERFPYEKDMLRDWFRKRFVELRAPRV
ncbi:MAG: DUF3016 domain-containing protein [Pseudomonadota bacterium]